MAETVAERLNEKKIYQRSDGKSISATQVILRARRYPELFQIKGESIDLLNRKRQSIELYLNLMPDLSTRLIFTIFFKYCMISGMLKSKDYNTDLKLLHELESFQEAKEIALRLLGKNNELDAIEKSSAEVNKLVFYDDIPDEVEDLLELAENTIDNTQIIPKELIKAISELLFDVTPESSMVVFSGIYPLFTKLLATNSSTLCNIIVEDDKTAFYSALLFFLKGYRNIDLIKEDKIGLRKFDFLVSSLMFYPNEQIGAKLFELVDLLKEGGKGIVILPSGYLTTKLNQESRAELIYQNIIQEIQTFQDTSLKRFCITLIKKTNTDSNYNHSSTVLFKSVNIIKKTSELIIVDKKQLLDNNFILQFSRYAQPRKFPSDYRTLGSISKQMEVGMSYRKPQYLASEGPVPYVQVSNLSTALGNPNYKLYMPLKIPNWAFVKFWNSSSVLISLIGSKLKPTVKSDSTYIAMGHGVVGIETKSNIVLKEFLALELSKEYVTNQFDSYRINSYMRLEDLKKIYVHVPSLEVQRSEVEKSGKYIIDSNVEIKYSDEEYLRLFKHTFSNTVGSFRDTWFLLRNYLTNKLNASDRIRKEDTIAGESIDEFLRNMEVELNKMVGLRETVEIILKNKYESLKLKKVDFGKYLEKYIKLNKQLNIDRKVTINLVERISRQIYIDTEKFDYVLSNFVDNSRKYAKDSMDEKINVYFMLNYTEDGQFIELHLIDNGKGFPLGYSEIDFKRKWSKEKSDGSGLGGAFMNSIVEDHNGELHFVNPQIDRLFIPGFNFEKTGVWIKIVLPIEQNL